MAVEIVTHIATPVDEYLQPYPIAPYLGELAAGESRSKNYHHGWHPASHPVLAKTLGGQALRARERQVYGVHHNNGPKAFHRFEIGPTIPEVRVVQFRSVVMREAGAVSHMAIDMSSGEPVEVTLTDAQLQVLKAPIDTTSLGYEGVRTRRRPVKEFIGDYVLGVDLGHINQDVVAAFLDPRTHPDQKERLGSMLLAEQVLVAALDVEPLYSAAQQAGDLHPNLTMDAVDFVWAQIIETAEDHSAMIQLLAERLALAQA